MVSIDIMYHNNIVVSSETRYRLHCITGRQIEPDSASNHQPPDCLLNHLFRRRSKKTSKLRVTGLCAGNSPGPVNSPYKWPVTRKMFPFDDVIMIHCERGTSTTNCSCSQHRPRARYVPIFYSRRYWTIWNKIMNQTAFEFVISIANSCTIPIKQILNKTILM